MEPYVYRGDGTTVETTAGTWFVPSDVAPLDLPPDAYADYVDGDPLESESAMNVFYGRWSAPGYMDCTPWVWADSLADVIESLRAHLDDDPEHDVEHHEALDALLEDDA